MGRAEKLPRVWHLTRLYTTLGSYQIAYVPYKNNFKIPFKNPEKLECLHCFQSRNLVCDGPLMPGE